MRLRPLRIGSPAELSSVLLQKPLPDHLGHRYPLELALEPRKNVEIVERPTLVGMMLERLEPAELVLIRRVWAMTMLSLQSTPWVEEWVFVSCETL